MKKVFIILSVLLSTALFSCSEDDDLTLELPEMQQDTKDNSKGVKDYNPEISNHQADALPTSKEQRAY